MQVVSEPGNGRWGASVAELFRDATAARPVGKNHVESPRGALEGPPAAVSGAKARVVGRPVLYSRPTGPRPPPLSRMLDDSLKHTIQSAYRQMLERHGFTPRSGQRWMIAEIARTVAASRDPQADDETPPPICVVEAGTGTGKTLAYLLAVLPLAQALKRKVVVSTATVALQEQVFSKDIPDLLASSGLSFSYTLAKGRGRYLCLARLDQALRGNDSLDAMRDLYGEDLSPPDEHGRRLYQRMLEDISGGRWEGDRDSWPEPVEDRVWRTVTVDAAQCMGARCAYFSQCAFFRARADIDRADCVVANHDLLLADLALGGGAILPVPANTLYIIDEAHHLPLKSNAHFAASTRLKGSLNWIQQCEKAVQRLAGEVPLRDTIALAAVAPDIQRETGALREDLQAAWLLAEQVLTLAPALDTYQNRSQFPFKLGVVPPELRVAAEGLTQRFSVLVNRLQGLADELKSTLTEGTELVLRTQAEQWFPVVGSLLDRATGAWRLWQAFAREDGPGAAPNARWLTLTELDGGREISLTCSPVLADHTLKASLWDTCSAAILTSATLSALGSFDMLAMRSGLPDHTRYCSIPSPFDFPTQGRLVVPRLDCDPGNSERHTALMVQALPKILAEDRAALVLFSSRRQMQDVMAGLPPTWRERVLSQDDFQKSQLLKYHRQRIDAGQTSVIFGLASFAEGVDLPGDYCTHVVIARIPFAVPNDPVEMTLADWVAGQGQDPFMTLAVPEAAFKLVQACGRLLRNEKDQGTITLLDERIINKFYGRAILDSLPPYRREIFQQRIQLDA